MDYRKSLGLPAIPFSPSLTFVAQLHARDLEINRPHCGPGNMHSWSDRGPWSRSAWRSIGVGIYGSYAVVWFGREPDPLNPEK